MVASGVQIDQASDRKPKQFARSPNGYIAVGDLSGSSLYLEWGGSTENNVLRGISPKLLAFFSRTLAALAHPSGEPRARPRPVLALTVFASQSQPQQSSRYSSGSNIRISRSPSPSAGADCRGVKSLGQPDALAWHEQFTRNACAYCSARRPPSNGRAYLGVPRYEIIGCFVRLPQHGSVRTK